jgi:hypothetical protein
VALHSTGKDGGEAAAALANSGAITADVAAMSLAQRYLAGELVQGELEPRPSTSDGIGSSRTAGGVRPSSASILNGYKRKVGDPTTTEEAVAANEKAVRAYNYDNDISRVSGEAGGAVRLSEGLGGRDRNASQFDFRTQYRSSRHGMHHPEPNRQRDLLGIKPVPKRRMQPPSSVESLQRCHTLLSLPSSPSLGQLPGGVQRLLGQRQHPLSSPITTKPPPGKTRVEDSQGTPQVQEMACTHMCTCPFIRACIPRIYTRTNVPPASVLPLVIMLTPCAFSPEPSLVQGAE